MQEKSMQQWKRKFFLHQMKKNVCGGEDDYCSFRDSSSVQPLSPRLLGQTKMKCCMEQSHVNWLIKWWVDYSCSAKKSQGCNAIPCNACKKVRCEIITLILFIYLFCLQWVYTGVSSQTNVLVSFKQLGWTDGVKYSLFQLRSKIVEKLSWQRGPSNGKSPWFAQTGP